MLKVGDKAPDFSELNEDGETLTLADFAGKKLVLYFYPKDNTPTCTTQACNLRDNYESLLQNGYAVIGISTDSVASHKRFKTKHNLPFPLIADIDQRMVQAYGVWGEKKNFGKTYMGVNRTTFVIDESGVITEIISKIDAKAHSGQIIKQ